MNSDGALPLCKTCSTQYDASHDLKACHICDDPRQYILPSGQAWTTLSELWQDKEQNYKNIFTQPYDGAPNIWTIHTEPVFGIGQRAFLLQTSHGNVLWDCVGYIDQETVDKINSLGGLKAIVISHPHFYSTHITWSRTFGNVPVYLASDDKTWLSRTDDAAEPVRRFVEEKVVEILPGVTAVKVGGHFPGSMVLHWADTLFVADSIVWA
ncbi:hypothetical protein EWM64_g2945 [Hericium alpestre]|uniref:Metallo-beta-lactamase domain-containing protein n=1 Tax=Hericium alpestre TaxID=135208 RepID=A0A4Z0A409_9AGAM|nr:hypothetical protein EWM64_g2945 [Hericium alpestre]